MTVILSTYCTIPLFSPLNNTRSLCYNGISKHTLCSPGRELRYRNHSLTRNEQDDPLELIQKADEIQL